MDNQQRIFLNNIEFLNHPVYNHFFLSYCGKIYNSKTGNLLKGSVSKAGYILIATRIQGKDKTLKLHRMVAETWLPPPSKDLVEICSKSHWKIVCVKHLDNNTLNNYASNLMWDSMENNTKDAFKDGLIPFMKGSSNGRAVLTEEKVHEICKAFESNPLLTPKQASEKFQISRGQSERIRNGSSWTHVSVNYNIQPLKKNVQRLSKSH